VEKKAYHKEKMTDWHWGKHIPLCHFEGRAPPNQPEKKKKKGDLCLSLADGPAKEKSPPLT